MDCHYHHANNQRCFWFCKQPFSLLFFQSSFSWRRAWAPTFHVFLELQSNSQWIAQVVGNFCDFGTKKGLFLSPLAEAGSPFCAITWTEDDMTEDEMEQKAPLPPLPVPCIVLCPVVLIRAGENCAEAFNLHTEQDSGMHECGANQWGWGANQWSSEWAIEHSWDNKRGGKKRDKRWGREWDNKYQMLGCTFSRRCFCELEVGVSAVIRHKV